MARIQFINTDFIQFESGTSVEVHDPDCRKVDEYRAVPLFDEMGDAGFGDFETAEDAFTDYNADFIAEGGMDEAWPVTVFPCSGLVAKRRTITEV